MAATIKTEMSVGLTEEIQSALETAVAFSGIKASQYARIALVEKLVRDHWMEHPGYRRVQNNVAQAAE